MDLHQKQLSFLYRYPSRYIDIQFRKLFAKHNVSLPSLLSLIDTPDKFVALRTQLLNQLSTPLRTTANNKVTVIIDRNCPTHVTVKRIWKQTEPSSESRLILHVPYEKRLRNVRKDIHQLWSNIFNNTNVLQTQLIIGTTPKPNIKLELVRTCPSLSKITLPK